MPAKIAIPTFLAFGPWLVALNACLINMQQGVTAGKPIARIHVVNAPTGIPAYFDVSGAEYDILARLVPGMEKEGDLLSLANSTAAPVKRPHRATASTGKAAKRTPRAATA